MILPHGKSTGLQPRDRNGWIVYQRKVKKGAHTVTKIKTQY